MKLGLLADVRGRIEPLRAALAVLQEAGADRVACLGSTAEGGGDDEAVLSALAAADALVLPSPHDAPESVTSRPAEAPAGGLALSHGAPEGLGPDEIFWLTGYAVPSVLAVREHHAATPSRRACGDAYAPALWITPDSGPARRRVFLTRESAAVPPGSFLACPGSVAVAASSPRGGSVAVFDEARACFEFIPFTTAGALPPRRPRARILVYCDDFEPHRPDVSVTDGVEFIVRASADEASAEVEAERPDLVLLDYHLAGKDSGLDALIALQRRDGRLPVPTFTISGNPTDSLSMKSAGATGALPFTYLRDVLTRLACEVSGA